MLVSVAAVRKGVIVGGGVGVEVGVRLWLIVGVDVWVGVRVMVGVGPGSVGVTGVGVGVFEGVGVMVGVRVMVGVGVGAWLITIVRSSQGDQTPDMPSVLERRRYVPLAIVDHIKLDIIEQSGFPPPKAQYRITDSERFNIRLLAGFGKAIS